MLGLRAKNFEEDEPLQPTVKATSSSTTSSASQSSGFDPSKFMSKNSKSTNVRQDPATPVKSTTTTSSTISVGQKPNVMFKFEPGSYDVVLFVDNCEQTA